MNKINYADPVDHDEASNGSGDKIYEELSGLIYS
jgi:hypothetical protein